MIIVIAAPKGGTGKTTFAINFAVMLALKKRDVFLYDTDPNQNTSTLWASVRDAQETIPRIQNGMRVFNERISNRDQIITNDLRDLGKKYEDIVVDLGPTTNEMFKAAVAMADKIIVPISPGEFDSWTFPTLNKIIRNYKKNEDIKGLIIPNRLTPQPGAAKDEIRECDEYLEDQESLRRMNNFLHLRKPIRKISGRGLAIIEAFTSEDKAAQEIKAVYNEVFNDEQ